VGVYELLAMSSEAGHFTGAALGPQPASWNLQQEVQRLERKVRAGARFAVTQPVFDPEQARVLHRATRQAGIPILLGILPLRTARHAEFLHNQVAGIRIPEQVRHRLEQAADPGAEGTAAAREMLEMARQHFAGACIMPAFGHYEILAEILD
jgi:homocysteine S-methyltransferase